MSAPKRWCNARKNDAVCERPHGHEGPHRAETGRPIIDKTGTAIAQVLSWFS